ncbi:MAG: SMI1/KNR4 family protein [Planctomycetaceae bacterium]|nr:SMI1/KNR4 family protein [Planctomycetaceae bacterium]
MLSLHTLQKVMQPPESPFETPNEDGWEFVEARLGFALPDDYKKFINCYGTGAVDRFLWVLNPFSENKHLNLFESSGIQLQTLRQLRDEFGEHIPYAVFPNPNGIFPWAITDNGDVLYWVCDGLPSNWLIVVNESRGPRWREYGLTTTDFLTKVITKELFVDVFPEDFPSESPAFVPAD